MICKKCKSELKEGEKFCSKCGKKVKNNSQSKKGKKLIYILTPIVLIIIMVVGIIVFISNKSKNDKENIGDINKLQENEVIRLEPNATKGATYSFTLDDLKKSMDKVCDENNMEKYPDFYDTGLNEDENIYQTFKDESNGSTGFTVTTYKGYVSEILFNYSKASEQNTISKDDVLFYVLKDIFDEEYSSKITDTLKNLIDGNYEFYKNTMCYKETFFKTDTTQYIISAVSNETYENMKETDPNMFKDTENDTTTDTTINNIDRSKFLSNLTTEDKEYLRKYVKEAYDLENDTNFIEDRFEIVGNEIIYISINVNMLTYGGANITSELTDSYYIITPMLSVPENWRKLDYTQLSNYLVISRLGMNVNKVSLYGNGINDEQIQSAKNELNPKIENQLNKYKKAAELTPSKEGLEEIANSYLTYICRNDSSIQQFINNGFDNNYIQIPEHLKCTESTSATSDYANHYCTILDNNKVLYIKYLSKSTSSTNYKESSYTEYLAIGILINIDTKNIPIGMTGKIADGGVVSELHSDSLGDFVNVEEIPYLIALNCIPKISTSNYVITPITKILSGENYKEQLADTLVNYIRSDFGV